jgi:predicted transcriptional regulator
MREVWTNVVPESFVVRDVLTLMPELAYTTVMTTLNRLADKKLLDVQAIHGQRAHIYRAAGDPAGFLARASREEVEHVVEQFGDSAIAAFAEHLSQLSPEQQRRLKELGEA